MNKQKIFLYLGILILIILPIAFYIKIPVESTSSSITISPLLGLLIFYNPYILFGYIAIAILLIYLGLKGKIRIV